MTGEACIDEWFSVFGGCDPFEGEIERVFAAPAEARCADGKVDAFVVADGGEE